MEHVSWQMCRLTVHGCQVHHGEFAKIILVSGGVPLANSPQAVQPGGLGAQEGTGASHVLGPVGPAMLDDLRRLVDILALLLPALSQALRDSGEVRPAARDGGPLGLDLGPGCLDLLAEPVGGGEDLVGAVLLGALQGERLVDGVPVWLGRRFGQEVVDLLLESFILQEELRVPHAALVDAVAGVDGA